MMKERRLLMVGVNAQVKYAAEICGLLGISVLGALAEQPDAMSEFGTVPILAGLDDFETVWTNLGKPEVLLCAAEASVKERLADMVDSFGAQYATLIHPAAVVASTAVIGPGCIVNPCATVQPFAVVGRHCMLHSHSDVEHDCEVGDFVNLAPGAILTGHAKAGQGARIHAHASVLPTVRIGAMAVVGAGAVVRENVPDGATVVGVPARIVKEDAP